MEKLTVGELKGLLADIPDEMEVVIGWQFHPVASAPIKRIVVNQRPVTAFQISIDE